MRHRLLIAVALCFGFMVTMGMRPIDAQQKGTKTTVAKQDRVEGSIHMLDKDAKKLTLRLSGKNVQRDVIYDESTKFTFRNKPGSLDQVKEGRRVICLGKYNDKMQLVATRIDVRDER